MSREPLRDIRTLYQNCRGLTTEKLDYYKSLLTNDVFDVVALAETWHPRFLQQHPDPFILASSLNFNQRRAGHADGGVSVLALPHRHDEFKTAAVQNCITLTHACAPTMTFAYVPPSLNKETLYDVIAQWPPTDIIVADFNVRLGGALPKEGALLDYCLANHLAYQSCFNGTPKLDHVLAKHETLHTLEMHHEAHGEVKTDHPALCFTTHRRVQVATAEEAETSSPSFQFNIRPLRLHAVTTALMVAAYQDVAPGVSRDFARCSRFLQEVAETAPDSLPIVAPSIIAHLDDMLLGMVQQTADHVLGRREPQSGRQHTNGNLNKGPRSLQDVTQQYVRLLGAASNMKSRQLNSPSVGVTPVTDAYGRWSTFWSDPRHNALSEGRLPWITTSLSAPHYITAKECRKRIMRQPNKAAHADGIHASILKALVSGSFPHHLTSLYNLCIRYQVTPSRWNSAITCLKPKTTVLTTEDCRPLSIVPLFRSLFEKALMPALGPHLERLHPAQIGFRPGQSTLTHIETLHRSEARIKVLIDYKKAFDSPLFDDLRQSWAKFGLPLWIQRLLDSLYTQDMTCVLVVNGCHSPLIHRTKGIFQGAVLSPHLFNIFTDEMVEKLNPHYPRSTSLLAFADDHTVLASTLSEARDLLQVAIAWAAPKGLMINSSKSSILDRSGKDSVITIGDVSIRSVKRATYLGIPFTPEGIDWEHYVTQNVKDAERHVRFLCYQTRSWPLMARAHLYRTFVRPTLEYGNALFALQTVNLDTATIHDHQASWGRLAKFHLYASRLIARQNSDNRLFPQLIGEPSPLDRAREIAIRSHLGGAPFAQSFSPPPSILSEFEDWNATAPRHWPESVTMKQRLSLFLRERSGVIDRRIDHRLDPTTQEHLLHWRKKSFAYRRICLCGDDFTQLEHEPCLPMPFGPMSELLKEANIAAIDHTFALWWGLLPPRR